MKKTSLLAIFAIAVSLSACKKDENKSAAPASIPPTPAVLIKAETKDIHAYIATLGTTASKSSVKIVPQVSGQIISINFTQGEIVKEGQILAVIDKRPYQAALNQAEGNLRQSKAQLKIDELQVQRNKTLAKDNYVDKQTYDALVAKVEVDKGIVEVNQAILDNAKINLDWCEIKAPTSGKVGLFNIDKGNVVTASTSVITTIEEVDQLFVDFVIPSQRLFDAQKLMKAQGGKLNITVSFIENDMAKYSRDASVEIVLNKIRYATGTAILRGKLDNKDNMFWPSQPVKVLLHLEKIENPVLVPDICVQTNAEGAYVYKATPNKAGVFVLEMIQIKKGELYDNNKLRLISGLKAGDYVVQDISQLRLQAGPFVYNATPNGLVIGEDGKPLTTPEAMQKFMTDATTVANTLRAGFMQQMMQKQAAAEKPAQDLRAATKSAVEATTPQEPKK